jgi:hypothetical protein
VKEEQPNFRFMQTESIVRAGQGFYARPGGSGIKLFVK